MDKGQFLVETHLRTGRSVGELARAHGISRSWLYKLLARYSREGPAGVAPRSRRPHHCPARIAGRWEEEIAALRKDLDAAGFDAGAATIHHHLAQRHEHPPSVSTIWRVLRARGFVTPQPHKRPKSSWVRFAAEFPNECWQADVTHVQGARGADGLELELLSLGIRSKHSRPYHPQTCGKAGRFHQTLKKYLARQDPPATKKQLQAQLGRFTGYYNQVRPHRAIGRATPAAAFAAREKAYPTGPRIDATGYRVRHDKLDRKGTVTLRHHGRLHHIPAGRPYRGRRVILLITGRGIQIPDPSGAQLRRLTLDPAHDYQPLG